MSDAEWAVVRDAMPVPGWLEGRGGQPESYCHRQLVDQCHEVKRQLTLSRPPEVGACTCSVPCARVGR
ncbi:hypothetical protein ACF07K_05490, partial [Streptomyces sp. NPDC015350]